MNMEQKERTLSEGLILTALFIITAVFFFGSVKLFLTDRSISSTGGFPLIVSFLMLLADLFMLLEFLKKAKPVKLKRFSFFDPKTFPVPVVYMMIAMVAYVTLLPRLGMIISTFVFLAYSIYFLSSIRLRSISLISAGSVAVIIILFRFVFRVNLP